MNVLNRVLIILATLLAVAAVTLAAALPAQTLAVVVAQLSALKGLADRLLPNGRLLVAGVGLIIDLLLLFWLWLEIRRPRYRTVQVNRADGASAEVTTTTLTERVEEEVDALAGVVWARAKVKSFGRSVEVAVEADILPNTPVAVTAGEIAGTVREVAETKMGLRLRGKPKVRIKAMREPDPPDDLNIEPIPAEPAQAALAPPEPEEQATALQSPPQS